MKQINVSVVGLSGTEKEKGQVGIGKSCLCNRFIRPNSDDYSMDHITVLSQSDFSGRVVNNDHFLYWGDVRKTSDEGASYIFSIVEQTEFIDDSTFQPFKVGKMEPYLKRCTATKLHSAEKLMYVCKNQLGIEKEYEQKVIPEGRISIDGFICVFDVALVPNRSIEKQIEYAHTIITNAHKAKKPVVLVTSKNDDANESFIREAEKLITRKEYKGSVCLVETSAHEGINVDVAFIILAQMIDKTKNRAKILSYAEASRTRKEIFDIRTIALTKLINVQISDYHTLWSQGSKMLSQHSEWIDFIDLFGVEAAQVLFRRHIKKLRDEFQRNRLNAFMKTFATFLQNCGEENDLFSNIMTSDWQCVKDYIKTNTECNKYFIKTENSSWNELCDMETDSRVPYDALDTAEAEAVFTSHVRTLQQERKRNVWRNDFKKLLEETGYVTPGKQFSEVRVLFMGRECFEEISETECLNIYDLHQKEIIENAKSQFLELLLEHVDLFQNFTKFDHTGTVTQEDIKHINHALQEDYRYKQMDRLDQDRKLMILQHLGFMHCPIREHCPTFPNCVDSQIEALINFNDNKLHGAINEDELLTFNLLIVGSEHLASDLINDVRINCGSNGEYICQNQTFYITYRIINGELDSLKTMDLTSSGLICVYSNDKSLEFMQTWINRSLMSNFELNDRFDNVPIALLFQHEDIDNNEKDVLRNEGYRISSLLNCEFLDASSNKNQFQKTQNAYTLLNNLISGKCSNSLRNWQLAPDLKISVCLFCGDNFSLEGVLTFLFVDNPAIISKGRNSVSVVTFLGDSKRCVEFVITSYHNNASQFREKDVHGYIVFYSTLRKSSLSNLGAFLNTISYVPLAIVAVTDTGGINAFFNSDMCQLLITEGNALADKHKAQFMTFSIDVPLKFANYVPFLKKIWDRKQENDEIYEIYPTINPGDEVPLLFVPQPPPRNESYLIKNAQCSDGSGSDNYEQLPTRSLNSLNGEKDNIIEEYADRGSYMHQGFQIYPPPATPPEPAPPDHFNLLSVNQLQRNVLTSSQSSLDEITSDISDSKDSLTHQYSDYMDAFHREAYGSEMDENFKWSNTSQRSFTTGRRQTDSNFEHKISNRVSSQTMQQPGKLNLKKFQLVSDAVARINIGNSIEEQNIGSHHESYKQENRSRHRGKEQIEYSDTDSDASSDTQCDGFNKLVRKSQTYKKGKKKKSGLVPVQPPKIPAFATFANSSDISNVYTKINKVTTEKDPVIDRSNEFYSQILEKENKQKEDRKKNSVQKKLQPGEQIKSSKSRESEKGRRKLKQDKITVANADDRTSEFIQIGKDKIPIFLYKCIKFIEKEGLDSEGIYRVPGNRVHVDLLFQKFQEDTNIDIEMMDIPVNAVATALKDFFSKKNPSILNPELMNELQYIAGTSMSTKRSTDVKSDRSCRLIALRELINKLPSDKFAVLKFIFQHFVRVSENSKYNSMDSKNLAICWWPTLLPIEFTDMGHFEQLRPYLEDIVQTMIDQFPYLFCGKEAFVMV